MEKHTAVYVRVSTRQQDTRSQLPDLRRWLAAYAADDRVVWYRDKFTGTTMERPGWMKLEKAIHSGQVSRVVTWRLDRLGRTCRGLSAMIDDLRSLISLKDGMDLSTPAGRLTAHVLASVAQFETEIRAERILAGQAVA